MGKIPNYNYPNNLFFVFGCFERSEGLQSPQTFLFFLSDPPATVGSLMATGIFTPNWSKYGFAGDF
jgi:hypothetical protein